MILLNNQKDRIKLLKIILISFIVGIVSICCYSYSPYRIEGLGYYNKIWAHRANSFQKANKAISYFEGIELDLVYDELTNTFDINHSPAISINLTLETYLANLKLDKKPCFWLDIKNLNGNNANLILIKINTLFCLYNYDFSKIIIETMKPEALPIFDKAGYMISYYLPYFLYRRTPSDLMQRLIEIKKNIMFQPNLMLSSDYRDYKILKENFPNRSKCFWALVKPLNKNFHEIRTVLEDTTVKVVLFNYKTLNYDR